jgi:hypothetical protein
MTTSANPVLTADETEFKLLVFDPLFQAGDAALAAVFPFLKVPIVAETLHVLEDDLEGYLYHWITLEVDIAAFKFESAERQAAYEAASLNLRRVRETTGAASSAYQKELLDAQAAMASFIHFNGQ